MTADVSAAVIPLNPQTAMTPEDRAVLESAVRTLEHPSLPARLSALVGQQLSIAGKFIPDSVVSMANSAANVALRAALRAAIRTLPKAARARPSRLHTALAAVSGAAGGLFGLSALPLELPVSTTIILRSIAEIARAEGEDPHEPATALACLEVFALGGGTEAGPAGEGGYLAIRAALAKSIQQATRAVLQRGIADETTPALVRFISQIVSRFSVQVSQKAVAQAVPVIGAVTGAAINAAFAEHFQALARAHFQVRRLERSYGAERVRAEYQAILNSGEDVPASA